MALEDSVFSDYNSALMQQGTPTIPGLDADPYAAIMAQIPGAPATPQMQAPAAAPQMMPMEQPGEIEQLAQHPMMQAVSAWKGASNAKRKELERSIFAQLGPVENALGADPTKDPVEEAWKQKEMVEAQKAGKDVKQKKPENRWDKFLKFVDENPQYLLEMGAKLLAPRRAGVSDLGHAVAGVSQATAALAARRSAARAAGLQGQKTQADIALKKGEIEMLPTEKRLKESQITKNLSENKPGDKTQRTQQYAAALRAEFPNLYQTDSAALLAAEQQLAGNYKDRNKFLGKFTTDNLIFFNNDPVATAKAAELAADTLGLTGGVDLEKLSAKERALEIKKNPTTLYNYLKGKYPHATYEQLQSRVEATAGKRADVPAPKKLPNGQAVGETAPAGTLEADLAAEVRKSTPKPPKPQKVQKPNKSKQLQAWKYETEPDAQGMINMTPEKAKTIRAQISKDYGTYTEREKRMARRLVKKLDEKFLK